MIAIGLCFAAVATLLVVVSLPHRLPSCEAMPPSSMDGGGGPCGDGLDAWTPEALAGAVIGGVFYVMALAAIVVGGRRRPVAKASE